MHNKIYIPLLTIWHYHYRLHLWDSDSKKEKRTYTEKNHLSHKIISFVYKSYENGALGPFAVSNDDGTIILWDLVRGVVSKVINSIVIIISSSAILILIIQYR